MDKRNFLRLSGLGLTSLSLFPGMWSSCASVSGQKNWIWMTPKANVPLEDWIEKLKKAKDHGFDAILMEVYNGHHAWFESKRLPVQEPLLEKLVEAGKKTRVEVHAWMWTMPNNIPEYYENHPDWFAVNRAGKNAATDPAYVPFYRFMCSGHQEVREFVRQNVAEIASIKGLTGVHLDYVRLPDAILAVALQPKYKIVQDKEYPAYDYCYCDQCRAGYKERTGKDPLKDLEDPTKDPKWRQFRYDTITHLVNDILVPEAHKADKKITAAVFPNWESVRQEWKNWKLDGYLPMLYHNFYNAGIPWIGEKIRQEISDLRIRKPVYSGLFVSSLKPDELELAYRTSMDAGAGGISLFSYNSIKESHWKVLKRLL